MSVFFCNEASPFLNIAYIKTISPDADILCGFKNIKLYMNALRRLDNFLFSLFIKGNFCDDGA